MHGQNKLYILINVRKLTSKTEHDFKFKVSTLNFDCCMKGNSNNF